MPFVLDASVTLNWAFGEEEHPTAEHALEKLRRDEAWVPSLWWFEVRNTLIVAERRGRLSEADTATFLHGLSRLGIRTDREPGEASILALARQHRLSVYDASYLELAQRQAFAIATLDKALRRAAQECGVAILGEM